MNYHQVQEEHHEDLKPTLQGIYTALRYLAKECRKMGFVYTAYAAFNAAETIILEQQARDKKNASDTKPSKRIASSLPKRSSMPRALNAFLKRTSGQKG